MYKIVAIDLDGTLFDDVKNISQENRDVIKKCHELGIKIVIATGRPTKGVMPVLNDLGLTTKDDYVILYNGAKIINVGTNEVISSTTIPGSIVKKLFNESQRLGVHFHAFRKNEELITPKHNPYTDIESRINHVEDHLFDFTKIDDNEEFIKAMMVDSFENINDIIPKVDEYYKTNYSVNRSSKIFLEFLNKKSDKGKALVILANYLNVSISETMAIGDAGNDLPMIKASGCGVVMQNAFDEIKAYADFITKSNLESGVAYAINKLIIEKMDRSN